MRPALQRRKFFWPGWAGRLRLRGRGLFVDSLTKRCPWHVGPAGRAVCASEAGDSLTKRCSWPAGCAFFAWITGQITQLLTGSPASRVRFDSVMEELGGFMFSRAMPEELQIKITDYYKSK